MASGRPVRQLLQHQRQRRRVLEDMPASDAADAIREAGRRDHVHSRQDGRDAVEQGITGVLGQVEGLCCVLSTGVKGQVRGAAQPGAACRSNEYRPTRVVGGKRDQLPIVERYDAAVPRCPGHVSLS